MLDSVGVVLLSKEDAINLCHTTMERKSLLGFGSEPHAD